MSAQTIARRLTPGRNRYCTLVRERATLEYSVSLLGDTGEVDRWLGRSRPPGREVNGRPAGPRSEDSICPGRRGPATS